MAIAARGRMLGPQGSTWGGAICHCGAALVSALERSSSEASTCTIIDVIHTGAKYLQIEFTVQCSDGIRIRKGRTVKI
jgi:hypothetical protein